METEEENEIRNENNVIRTREPLCLQSQSARAPESIIGDREESRDLSLISFRNFDGWVSVGSPAVSDP